MGPYDQYIYNEEEIDSWNKHKHVIVEKWLFDYLIETAKAWCKHRKHITKFTF